MLVLTMYRGENIIIGDNDIIIKFLNINHYQNQIRLGFNAAENIKIFRESIFKRDRARFNPKHYPLEIKEHIVNGNRVDNR